MLGRQQDGLVTIHLEGVWNQKFRQSITCHTIAQIEWNVTVIRKFEIHAQDQYLNLMGFTELMFLFEGAPCKCSQSKVSIFGIMKRFLFLNTIELYKIKWNLCRIVNHDSSNCQSVCASKFALIHQQWASKTQVPQVHH